MHPRAYCRKYITARRFVVLRMRYDATFKLHRCGALVISVDDTIPFPVLRAL